MNYNGPRYSAFPISQRLIARKKKKIEEDNESQRQEEQEISVQ